MMQAEGEGSEHPHQKESVHKEGAPSYETSDTDKQMDTLEKKEEPDVAVAHAGSNVEPSESAGPEPPFTFDGSQQSCPEENGQKTFVVPEQMETSPKPSPTDVIGEHSFIPAQSENPSHTTKADEDSNLSTDVADLLVPSEPFKPVEEDAQSPTDRRAEANADVSVLCDFSTDAEGLSTVAAISTTGARDNDVLIGDQNSTTFAVTQNGESADQPSLTGDSLAREVSEQTDVPSANEPVVGSQEASVAQVEKV